MKKPNNTRDGAVARRTSILVHLSILPVCLLLTGCITAAKHQQQLGSNHERLLTLGLVQKEIAVGMSQADVAAALGSPNIVTGNIGSQEVWIYDKVSTETSYSHGSGGVTTLLSGNANFPGSGMSDPSGGMRGDVMGGYYKSTGAASLNQRTLTVVIKFTADKAVDSVSYNSTRF